MLLQDILSLGSIGLHTYQYLHPKDLLSLAICNHELWNGIVVHQKIATICMSHLPLQIGIGTNYIVDFVDGISFHNQEDLLDFILNKTEAANLLFDGTTTIDESRNRAREMLLPTTVRCQHARFYHTPSDKKFSTTIECHYQWGIEKSSALSWVKYILDREACKQNVRDRETNYFIWEWLKFLFALHSSRRNNNLITFGMWRWSCKNPNLYGHGIAGVGVMIDIRQQHQQQPSGHENSTTSHTFEVRLTRNY